MTVFVRYLALALIEIISLLLLVRAVLSWVVMLSGAGNRLYQAISYITDPILMPFRMLFDRLGINRLLPIDLSFLATIIVLQMLTMIL